MFLAELGGGDCSKKLAVAQQSLKMAGCGQRIALSARQAGLEAWGHHLPTGLVVVLTHEKILMIPLHTSSL